MDITPCWYVHSGEICTVRPLICCCARGWAWQWTLFPPLISWRHRWLGNCWTEFWCYPRSKREMSLSRHGSACFTVTTYGASLLMTTSPIVSLLYPPLCSLQTALPGGPHGPILTQQSGPLRSSVHQTTAFADVTSHWASSLIKGRMVRKPIQVLTREISIGIKMAFSYHEFHINW